MQTILGPIDSASTFLGGRIEEPCKTSKLLIYPRYTQNAQTQIETCNRLLTTVEQHRYTSEMRFEERDLKPYAQPVTAKVLEQGKVYFSVQFADDNMLIPIMETWVFAGRNLDSEDAENHLFFQDVESYLQGIRYGTATTENATFQIAPEENTKHFFDYEYALEELLRCSLRRRKGAG